MCYDDIVQVCPRFNNISQSLLNKGVTAVRLHIRKCMNEITDKLPRRASDRKGHPLSKQLSALKSINSLHLFTFIYYF